MSVRHPILASFAALAFLLGGPLAGLAAAACAWHCVPEQRTAAQEAPPESCCPPPVEGCAVPEPSEEPGCHLPEEACRCLCTADWRQVKAAVIPAPEPGPSKPATVALPAGPVSLPDTAVLPLAFRLYANPTPADCRRHLFLCTLLR